MSMKIGKVYILFDIRGYLEIPVFEISRVECSKMELEIVKYIC